MSPKESRYRFQNLINGVFMKDFSYEYKRFTFKTVFYVTPYSYRCCPCSYEFEYLEFISDTGEINETMFQNVLQSLTNGQCPHVDGADADHVKKTACHGLHVAAALEDNAVLQHHRDYRSEYMYYSYMYSGPAALFRITPCHMAVLKGKGRSLKAMLDIYWRTSSDWRFLYWSRSEDDRNKILFVESSFLEQCVRKDNAALLKAFINWDVRKGRVGMDISSALKFAILHKQSKCKDILLRNMKKFERMADVFHVTVIDCAVIAIIYDIHDVLKRLLKVLSYMSSLKEYESELSIFTAWLPRPDCKDVLESFGVFCNQPEPSKDIIHDLIPTLDKYLDCDNEEIIAILKSVPGIAAIINSEDNEEQTPLQKYLKNTVDPSKIVDRSPNPKIVKILFDLGSDVNKPFTSGETPLKFLLRVCVAIVPNHYMYKNVRWTLEILLNENPDFEVHVQENEADAEVSITQLALKLDKFLISQVQVLSGASEFVAHHHAAMTMNNSAKTDSHHAEGTKNAMNFLLPLLIECGYLVNRDNLLDREYECLATAENEYIQRVLDSPRGLSLICRDSLRNHFKGRKIVDYLEMIHAPKRIKDFVLLSQELLMLNGAH